MKLILNELYKNKEVVWILTFNDFKTRYLGSVLGVVWVFLLPLLNVLIMWFALEKGLKAGSEQGVPLILWLITGNFPWMFFSEGLTTSTQAILEKAYLVKKVVFHVELLPVIKILSTFLVFCFFIIVMCVFFLLYGMYPTVYWLQIPYLVFCVLALLMSLAWLTSSIVVFYKDISQVIGIFLQVGFWLTPIFWRPELLPPEYKFILFCNPVNYIISGFRDVFFEKMWFWQRTFETLYFWLFVLIIGWLGLFVFRKLRPHFADVI